MEGKAQAAEPSRADCGPVAKAGGRDGSQRRGLGSEGGLRALQEAGGPSKGSQFLQLEVSGKASGTLRRYGGNADQRLGLKSEMRESGTGCLYAGWPRGL